MVNGARQMADGPPGLKTQGVSCQQRNPGLIPCTFRSAQEMGATALHGTRAVSTWSRLGFTKSRSGGFMKEGYERVTWRTFLNHVIVYYNTRPVMI